MYALNTLNVMDDTLAGKVQEWLRLDKNQETLNEVEQLVASGNVSELNRSMSKRIEFGTAGLRSKMGAGWARMNDLIIIQTSQGLGAYVLDKVPNAKERGIVVGHDHRHHSEKWAELVAMVFLNFGYKVYLHKGLVHTPLVPFSVSKLNAACGVMITASHNPKQDNGYKVYWENAVQIIGPHDTGIAKSIGDNLVPLSWDASVVNASINCLDVVEDMRAAYFATISKLSFQRSINSKSTLKFVNTSMHGVGHLAAVKAFEAFGLPPFTPVREQQEPDPEFPTVKFPNPEEKGALELAMKEADAVGANYILAQDPDADRFAAAEKGPDGKWVAFTGDQLGAIFASHCLDMYKASGKAIENLAMVASTVSSKMVESMAIKEGFKFAECLTGFKYIGNTALQLVENGLEVTFGYEEAIGFMIGSSIRDKDGVSATACFAELAVALHSRGSSVIAYLNELYRKYGFYKTENSYFICNEPPTIDKIFAKLRNYDSNISDGRPNYPSTIAGLKIVGIRDLTVGYDSANPPTFKPTLPLSSGHMIQFKAQAVDSDTKITLTIRTSGTEPKIKYYLEGSGKNFEAVDKVLPEVLAELRDVWMEAELNDLILP